MLLAYRLCSLTVKEYDSKRYVFNQIKLLPEIYFRGPNTQLTSTLFYTLKKSKWLRLEKENQV